MTVHDYRIEFNRFHGTVHCLAGGRTPCTGKPEYLLHFEYPKSIKGKDGVKREISIAANRPACRMHAEKFAKKHKVLLPVAKPSR